MRVKMFSNIGTKINCQALFLAFLVVILSGCSMLPEEDSTLAPPLVKPKRAEYELYEVTRRDITKTLKGTGTLISSKEVALYYRESGGRLKSIEVKDGQKVTKGTIMARLDTGNLESRIKIKANDIKKAEIQLELLKSEYEKYLSLPRESQPPSKDMEEMKVNIRLQEIDLDSARIEYSDLLNDLQQSRLISPIDGVVTFVENLKAGDVVEAYKTIIIVADPRNLQLYYQSDATKDVKVGMKAKVECQGKELDGKVVLAPDNVPEDALEKYKNAIVISVNGLPDNLEWGDMLDFTIEIQSKKNVLCIPKKGLRRFMGGTYVQVLDGESKKEYNVETGIETIYDVEILSGLKEGQKVILN